MKQRSLEDTMTRNSREIPLWKKVAVGTTAALGTSGLFLTTGCAADNAPTPSVTSSQTGEATPSTSPSGQETPSMTPTPTETTSTPEVPKGDVFTNENTTELSPRLTTIYEAIAGKVERGEVTYDDYLGLTDDEKALLEQGLLYKLIENGAGNLDTSICYMKDESDPGCIANFASKDDTNEQVFGKIMALMVAGIAYSDDGGKGLSENLSPEASRILGDVAFYHPTDGSASSRFGGAYKVIQGYIDEGVRRPVKSIDVEVSNPSESGDESRSITAVMHKPSGPVKGIMKVILEKHTIDGASANKLFGLDKDEVIKLAQWKEVSERVVK